MTDGEYLFRSHSKETKRIARGSYAKRGGSKSKSCRLPSDNLTQAQKNKLNGKVVTINMAEKMTWEQVKKLPKDLAKEYILSLRENHKGRNNDIAKMLGVEPKAFSAWMNAYFPELKIRGGNNREVAPEWIAFINQNQNSHDDEGEPKDDEIEMKEEKPEKEPAVIPKCNVLSGTLRFEGLPGIAFTKAMQILENKDYNITILFEEVCNVNTEA